MNDMPMEMPSPDLSDAVMSLPGGSNPHNSCLLLEVDGSLWWGGGISGNLIVRNPMGTAVEDWEVSFLTPHSGFESWSGDVQVSDAGNGLNRVTFAPAAWNRIIPANGELSISFNAKGQGLADSGALTNAEFFSGTVAPLEPALTPFDGSGESAVTQASADPMTADSPAVPAMSQSSEQDAGDAEFKSAANSANSLSLDVSGSLYWGGMSGILTITNNSDRVVEDWSVSFETPHSDFQSWAGAARVEPMQSGGSKVTLTPATWNSTIAAGQSIDVSFNAISEGIPSSGELTSALFFSEGSASESSVMDLEVAAELVAAAGLPDSSASAVPQAGASSPANADRVPAEPDQISESSQSEQPAGSPEDLPELESLVIAPESMSASSANVSGSGKKVVAYFEEWGIYERDFLARDINVEQLTHINYSFFDVKANGEVELFDRWAATDKRFTAAEQVSRTFAEADWLRLDQDRRDAYTSGDNFTASINADGSVTVAGVPMGWNAPADYAGNLRQFDLIKQLHPEINLGFALGGWTLSDEFSLAVDSEADRDAFTDNIIDIFKQYDFFNAVDFDWEYPGGGGDSGNAVSVQDGVNFALTLELLKDKLDVLEQATGEEYEVSIATAGGYDKLSNLNLTGIDPFVDFYNVMTYDFHGGWESVTGHQAAMIDDPAGYDIATAINQFQINDVDLSKVVLGVPTYTRAWGNVDVGDAFGLGNSGDARQAPGSYEAGNYDQKDLITGVSDGSFALIWDDNSKAAYVYNEDSRIWSSIETPATVAGKTAFIDDMGLGGMMFWALSNDASGDQSLISAASELIRGSATYEQVVSRSEPFDFILGGDGQFGLGDFT